MASGLNKRKMIQHAVFKELVKVGLSEFCYVTFLVQPVLCEQYSSKLSFKVIVQYQQVSVWAVRFSVLRLLSMHMVVHFLIGTLLSECIF